ncbi:hypothetical protein TNCV_257001 [Trichonephila clavipes]|nr:hypothetical protein TNCV_257001 [Trichonephila clavipes]
MMPVKSVEAQSSPWNGVKVRRSPSELRPPVPNSVPVTLDPEVHEQMFRSGGQPDAKPPVLNSQASLVLILSTH